MTEEQNDLWSKLDGALGVLRDFFAVVGVVATLAFVLGYFWVVPL